MRCFRPVLMRLRRRYPHVFARRNAGLRAELDFWDYWLRTHGRDWPGDYERRLDPELPLAPGLATLVDTLPHSTIHILDVGAGPLTVVGKRHPTKTLVVTATDVLASYYDRLLRRYQITPPVRTLPVAAEALAQYFPTDHFDLVYAQNSIDHTAEPFLAIEAMIAVVKPGGWVVLAHEENEADSEAYSSLHQWNFTSDGTAFLIRGRSHTRNVSAELAPVANVTCTLRDHWLTVQIQKCPV